MLDVRGCRNLRFGQPMMSGRFRPLWSSVMRKTLNAAAIPVNALVMAQTCNDPDPYADLDNRADASELSEDFRKPVKIRRERTAGGRTRPR